MIVLIWGSNPPGSGFFSLLQGNGRVLHKSKRFCFCYVSGMSYLLLYRNLKKNDRNTLHDRLVLPCLISRRKNCQNKWEGTCFLLLFKALLLTRVTEISPISCCHLVDSFKQTLSQREIISVFHAENTYVFYQKVGEIICV